MRLSHRASLAKTLSTEAMNCLVSLESFVPPFIDFLPEQIRIARLAVKVSPLGGRKHEKLLLPLRLSWSFFGCPGKVVSFSESTTRTGDVIFPTRLSSHLDF